MKKKFFFIIINDISRGKKKYDFLARGRGRGRGRRRGAMRYRPYNVNHANFPDNLQQVMGQLQAIAAVAAAAGQIAAGQPADGQAAAGQAADGEAAARLPLPNNQAVNNNPLVAEMQVPPHDPIQVERLNQDVQNNERNCAMCLTALATRAYIPCGHYCACAPCAERIDDGLCPLCRQNVAGRLTIY